MDETTLFDGRQYAVSLSQRDEYGAPPLSVIDASQPAWYARRALWRSYYPCLEGAVGREDLPDAPYRVGNTTSEVKAHIDARGGDTSLFDPVLAEICYRWWTRPGSEVFDPFAGGPTRGVVAAELGRYYLGIDLRAEQVEANLREAPVVGCHWEQGDAATYIADPCDFVFSCPPYGSLEVYSDSPADLSAVEWPRFQALYRRAIEGACTALRPDRFACFVVGNYKEGGRLRDLEGLTIAAFEAAGLEYYADTVLMTPIGSAAIRAAYHFPRNRRPTRRHQMVLTFVKGSAKAAVAYVSAGSEPPAQEEALPLEVREVGAQVPMSAAGAGAPVQNVEFVCLRCHQTPVGGPEMCPACLEALDIWVAETAEHSKELQVAAAQAVEAAAEVEYEQELRLRLIYEAAQEQGRLL